jgi:glucose 1-dehydrogenase
MAKLDDRVAVITGSDSSMGQAMAEELAKEGAHIAITFHTDKEGTPETRRRVEAAGRRAFVQQVDVRDEAGVATLFEAVERELGTPDISSTMPAWAQAARRSPTQRPKSSTR